MSKNIDIYYHVGLPKTATTFLQHQIFPKFEGIRFVRKHDFKYHASIIKNEGHQKYLFSVEHDVDMDLALKEFSALYPGAKIIISLRRQDKWIASKYRYYIRKSGWLDFNSYFDLQHNTGMLKVEQARYMNYIRMIKKYFDTPPLIVFQDDLKKDMFSVLDMLATYLGASYNKNAIKHKVVKKAFNDKQLHLLKAFNNTFKHNTDRFSKTYLRRPHIITRKWVVHTFAFFVNFIPGFMLGKIDLIPDNALEKINDYYKDDWESCLENAKHYKL